MFERFTDRARRVVVLAQEEARLLDHNYIGTEHILLGLIHEGEGVAAEALNSLGIALDAVRSQVEEIIGQGSAAPTGHIPFTPRAKKVLELSLRESLQLGHNYIGTEHILLGLVREGEGVAAQVLVKLGADLHSVRAEVIRLLEGYTGEAHPEGLTELRTTLTGIGRSVAGMPRLSHDSTEAMDLAREIARKMGHDTVQPADILLGLLGSSDLDVAVILQRLGVDLQLLKVRLDEMASEETPDGASGRGDQPADEEEAGD
jgi:ATP-dependent Clp protease ATP-binding subunit ClpA